MYSTTKMSLRWRKKTHWPPSPCVEDEAVSLSRELHGSSQIGEMPGLEGVCSRGTVDQYPVLVDVFSYSSYEETTVIYEDFSRDSSSEDNVGPPTPVDEKQDPMLYLVGDDQAVSLSAPLASREKPQDQPKKPAVQRQDSTTRGRPRADTRAQRDSPPKRDTAQSSRNASRASNIRTPAVTQSKSTPSLPRRFGSVKHGRSADALTTKSGYQSDSATVKSKTKPEPVNKPAAPQTDKKSSTGLSVAERLEEKIRQRQELRAKGGSSDVPKTPSPPSTDQPSVPVELPAEPSMTPAVTATPKSTAPKTRPRSTSTPKEPATDRRADEHEASSSAAAPAPQLPPRPGLATKPAGRSISSDKPQSTAQLPARRAVSFLDDVPQRSSSLPRTPEDIPEPPPLPRRRSSSQDAVRHRSSSQDAVRQTSPKRPFFLPPCPRSTPIAGYQDWHTVKGLPHLNICPSCMKQMRKSEFRDHFVLASPRSRGEKIRCSMSEPWTRLAWMQTLKKQLDHLELLHQITRPPLSIKPCPGRIITEQHWYRIVDPETNMYLPQFNVCSACVRNLRVLMPQHRDTFKRSSTKQERACDFLTDSPRFVRYIDCLDIAANRADQEHMLRPDVTEFLSYARRKVVLRDCRRDRRILSTWHYMPQLPELTVCEDCYDDVVWPLVRAKHPIARKFSTSMRLLPGDGPSRCREASCQLYSPRMRAKFAEAVQSNDLMYLKQVALRRRDAEQRYRDREEELLEDASRGYDVEGEMRRNVEEWKRNE
ncbi:uncharacterized protein BO87DRAFT_373652 [Aspergillus neoniger CBS 115656]|uniref:Uncharacterized protein n=1 Tax=Aspergillus neoniger (strain CBS 115656) TaxID=1448310 RepID=A0A318ZQ94_ASPNB|nr:hypothetical protein BO87DRAFT_373652 [Aspergillus neoniger CBS 115656]PYH37992.1 hypothetical protein BO87DRAFT_373652 [Aspergillus neoniger CBS 115656]